MWQLFTEQESAKQALDDHAQMTAAMKESHEEELASLTTENDSLKCELKKTRFQSYKI